MRTAKELAGRKLDGGSPINITFAFDYQFNRGGPPGALQAHMRDNRTLNYSLYDDCKTGEELIDFAATDCPSDPDWKLPDGSPYW